MVDGADASPEPADVLGAANLTLENGFGGVVREPDGGTLASLAGPEAADTAGATAGILAEAPAGAATKVSDRICVKGTA